MSTVKAPDLLIYLSSIPNLVDKYIKEDANMKTPFLLSTKSNERYEAWVHTYDRGKILIIDVDNINFVDNPEDLGIILNKIDAELNGLF
jgi:deoxyadenosine/deoxycytidine kinase